MSGLSSQKVVTTRKAHRCWNCGREIAQGERALSVSCFPTYEFNPRPGTFLRATMCRRCSGDAPEWSAAPATSTEDGA